MISDKLDNSEMVCEGWLTKSPPTTRVLRARWRRRYFILRHSGQLPGQYFLCYYTDRNCRKVKGQIDLDQCDQVDAGLRIEKYHHLFTIRTPKRIYYLAAETTEEMNKWVDCVCHVCGLKPFTTDDVVTEDGDNISQATTGITEISPPITPCAIMTGPYISISECITGKPIKTDNELKQFMLQHGSGPRKEVVAAFQRTPNDDHRVESYDMPRPLHPPREFVVDSSSTPPPSPGSESVFTDDESVLQKVLSLSTKKPVVNWETFPRPSDSSVDESDCGVGVNALTLKAERKFAKVSSSVPPRPPKPSYLMAGTTTISIPSTYAITITSANSNTAATTVAIFTATPTCTADASPNETRIEEKNTKGVGDMYDIPRSYRTTGRQLIRNFGKHEKKKFHEIQYLDLDLEVNDKEGSLGLVRSDSGMGVLVKKSSESTHMPSTATVYKTVDFLKTEAFNRTRIEIEEERSRLCMAAESAL